MMFQRSMKYQKNCFQGKTYDALEQECFETIKQEIFSQSFVNKVGSYQIACDDVKVSLPVRVNWEVAGQTHRRIVMNMVVLC